MGARFELATVPRVLSNEHARENQTIFKKEFDSNTKGAPDRGSANRLLQKQQQERECNVSYVHDLYVHPTFAPYLGQGILM